MSLSTEIKIDCFNALLTMPPTKFISSNLIIQYFICQLMQWLIVFTGKNVTCPFRKTNRRFTGEPSLLRQVHWMTTISLGNFWLLWWNWMGDGYPTFRSHEFSLDWMDWIGLYPIKYNIARTTRENPSGTKKLSELSHFLPPAVQVKEDTCLSLKNVSFGHSLYNTFLNHKNGLGQILGRVFNNFLPSISSSHAHTSGSCNIYNWWLPMILHYRIY